MTPSPEPPSIDEHALLGCYGISAREWACIKRDVDRGARHFWRRWCERTGLPMPTGEWKGTDLYSRPVRGEEMEAAEMLPEAEQPTLSAGEQACAATEDTNANIDRE